MARSAALSAQQAPILSPETALDILSANSKDVDSTLIDLGLSEASDPLLDQPMVSDPRYRQEHGGRPVAPKGGKTMYDIGQPRSDPVSMVEKKRRKFREARDNFW